jgi:hypothetical protein
VAVGSESQQGQMPLCLQESLATARFRTHRPSGEQNLIPEPAVEVAGPDVVDEPSPETVAPAQIRPVLGDQ